MSSKGLNFLLFNDFLFQKLLLLIPPNASIIFFIFAAANPNYAIQKNSFKTFW